MKGKVKGNRWLWKLRSRTLESGKLEIKDPAEIWIRATTGSRNTKRVMEGQKTIQCNLFRAKVYGQKANV